MTNSFLTSISLLVSTLAITALASKLPPSTGKEWISLGEGIEFQPAAVTSDKNGRLLKQAQKRFLEEQAMQQDQQQQSQQQNTPYLDSQETYYDGYAQSWRYVGFYTDCSPYQDDHRRRLNEDEVTPCVRYLLWAAYVDLDYQGGGIGEYQFYDTYAEEWDTSACLITGNVNEDGEVGDSCKKMDCHLPNTKWQLMGYFKEIEYTEWFEQLFKHEGYCVWQEYEYEFMYENYNAWPEGCTDSEVYLSDGTLLYYDTKAGPNATMTYGLYTDARCSVDYTGDEVTLQSLLAQGDGDDALSWENLQYWNDAMEIYRVCQPCRAYALHDIYGGRKLSNKNKKRKLDDNDPNGGLFQCDDAAGYTNVNQCMKFRTKTDMEYATLEEVLEAAHQGGITTLTVEGVTYGEFQSGMRAEEVQTNWTLLGSACGVLGFGLLAVMAASIWSRTRCRASNRSLREPLISDLS